MVRACFSGDPSCTGIAPCDACAEAVNTRVLPKAMVAGGFNGSIEIASRFFDAYSAAKKELQEKAPHEMAQAMGAPQAAPPPNPAPVEEPANVEEDPAKKEVTEDEITSMGQIEDTVEEPGRPETSKLSPKHARAMARMALAIKKKRANSKTLNSNTKKEEDTHG